MINENDLLISNKSYINKDFATIYPELIETAKKLSYKYDPETSNESDPFIVLLKLLAFVGDKLNYNVDKNVLERFMPSATQENTMRDLTSMLGYNMNYYIAPETEIFIKYIGDEKFEGTHKSFTFPKLNTVITDADGETQFVLTEDCVIQGYNVTELKGTHAIQGIRRRLTVFNTEIESEKILLENLDENNRIYFPEKKVGQNAVFVSGGNLQRSSTIDGNWTRKNNLNIEPLGSFIYVFGYDSNKGYPYVQFPSDIANLIGDGITIDYIVTDGLNGNISAKKLTTLKTPIQLYWDNCTEEESNLISFSNDENEASSLIINNPSGTINGADPESVDEAYNNYKKIIGTFDTLVTCRDYANAIYNLKDINNIYDVVSNVQVADRRTDMNKATNIVTYSQFGKEYINTVPNGGITAYDLVMYPLTPMKVYSVDSYKESFLPLVYSAHNSIESDIENSMCLSHNYVYPSDNDIYNVKNYYKIKAFITTSYKVNGTEGAAILSNINKALVDKFNARNIDYGYEIPYDTLLNTIEQADERIKAVSLYEPELETKFLRYNSNTNVSEEFSLFDNHFKAEGETEDKPGDIAKSFFILTVAKNVLSGKISLYDYYDKFNFEFGQKAVQGYLNGSTSSSTLPLLIDNIESVSTNAHITIPVVSSSTDTAYTLNQNEVIQIVSPSLITQVTYPYGINYFLKLNNSVTNIPQNTEYELKEGELCVFEYTDSNDQQVVKVYKHTTDVPTILKPNFDMYTTAYRQSIRPGYSRGETALSKLIKKQADRTEIGTDVDSENKLSMFTLTTNDTVEYRTINQVDMQSTSYCTWIVNNDNNEIIWDTNNQHMLENGEYFFQTDLGFNELISYGSGTVITKTGFNTDWTTKKPDLNALDDVGLLGHKEYFVIRNVDASNKLNFLEQEIITLITGDSIKASSSISELTNTFNTSILNKGVEYKLSTSESEGFTSVPVLSYTGSYLKARALLDLNCGPDTEQILYGNQEMIFKTKSGETISSAKIKKTTTISPIVKLERQHQLAGGDNINIVTVNLNDTKTKLYDTVCIYQKDADKGPNSSNGDFEILGLSATTSSKTYSIPNVTGKSIMMLYTKDTQADTVTNTAVKITFTGGTITNLSDGTSVSSNSYLKRGMTNLLITNTNTTTDVTITLTLVTTTATGATITIRQPRHLNAGVYNNDKLGLTTYHTKTGVDLSSLQTQLLTTIRTLDKDKGTLDKGFYYCCDIDNSKTIEYDDLSSAYAFYDYNNIANKWTLSEIDFSDGQPDISITRSSML